MIGLIMLRDNVPFDDTRDAYKKMHRNTLRLMKESKNNINLPFLKQSEHDIRHHTGESCNQYLVIFTGGKYGLIPHGCDGKKVPDYLGIKFSRLEYWTPLPSKASSLNPLHKNTLNERRDIYECE